MPINTNQKQNENFSQVKAGVRQTGTNPSKRKLKTAKGRSAPNAKVK
jgi:hypothetical protein